MKKDTQKNTLPKTDQQIYKINVIVIFLVTSVFVIKNLVAGSYAIAGGIFAALVVAAIVFGLLSKTRISMTVKTSLITCFQTLFIFVISTSGAEYSDDFLLFLTSAVMSGIYFRPKVIVSQIILCDILLNIMFFTHPEKAGNPSQFYLCFVAFNATAITLFILVQRGKTFIDLNKKRAAKLEEALNAFATLNDKLQQNIANTTERLDKITEEDAHLTKSSETLQNESSIAMESVNDTNLLIEQSKGNIRSSFQSIEELNTIIKTSRDVVKQNWKNIVNLETNLENTRQAFLSEEKLLLSLNEQMHNIQELLKDITKISKQTDILALNAFVEATYAGEAGQGFTVVATSIKELAGDSKRSTSQISELIKELESQIEVAQEQLKINHTSMTQSNEGILQLKDSFNSLTNHFESLQTSIKCQNSNIEEIYSMFEHIKEEMSLAEHSSSCTQENVEQITSIINDYQSNIHALKDDAVSLEELITHIHTLLNKTE